MRISWSTRAGRFLINYFQSKIHKSLDELILEIEGFYKHIPELTGPDVVKMLKSTNSMIRFLDQLDENLQSINYMGAEDLKFKCKYALKTLYRLESLLHIESTRDVEIEKTDSALLQSLTDLSILSISKSIYE